MKKHEEKWRDTKKNEEKWRDKNKNEEKTSDQATNPIIETRGRILKQVRQKYSVDKADKN